jgi:hypothetical protein
VSLDSPGEFEPPAFSLLQDDKLTGPLATHLIGREPLITSIGELAKWAEIRRWGTHRCGELATWLVSLSGYEAVAAIRGAVRSSQPTRASRCRRTWLLAYRHQP